MLTASIEDRQKLTQEFNQRAEKLKQSVEEDQHRYRQKLQAEEVWILIWLSSVVLHGSRVSLVVSVISTHSHDTGKINTPTVGRIQTSQSVELFPPTVPRLTANTSTFFY